ncbi:alkaline phosphatase family protein [Candidatus Babeliales bacterium]|nr:alkaline phosphatase family protein [Candidatus Babeliales bacterium]
MKKLSRKISACLFLSFFFFTTNAFASNTFANNTFASNTVASTPPKLVVIFIVDQFAYHYLDKIEPFLTGGIRFMLDNGITYENAYMPHAHPATGSGHVAFNTGCYAKDHGIVGNKWFSKQGKSIRLTDGITSKNKVFDRHGQLYDYDASGENILVDGISDQLILDSQPNKKNKVFSLSYKDRAAVGMAGKLGKAIWFEKKKRHFTTSKAYFEKLPEWVKAFNEKHLFPKTPPELVWHTMHPQKKLAYDFYNATNYNVTSHDFSLINKPFKSITTVNPDGNLYKELFIKTPHANQILLDLSKECLEHNFSKSDKGTFVLWVGLTPLDPLGHYYGPDSKEAIDMLYHLDWQLKHFFKYLNKKVDSKDLLLALSADHGVMPIPENLQRIGLSNAHRLDQNKLIKEINKLIEKKFKLKDIVWGYKNGYFYLNKPIFYNLNKTEQNKILEKLKIYLKKQQGVQEVWTQTDIQKLQAEPGSIDSYFKNQLYPARSGELTCKLVPYAAITKHKTGTNHRTPYEYDTHIPLMLYQKKSIQKKKIYEKVTALQFANTLAKICQTQKPAASKEDVLPI